MHDSLDPCKPITETAFRAVQPFFAQITAQCPYTILSKLALSMGMWTPSNNLVVPWAHRNPQPKRHLDWFSHFAGLTSVKGRQTDRPRYLVGNNRPHLRNYVVLRCGLVITFRVSRRRREMYCGHARLCICLCVCVSVCLSAAACLDYYRDPDVTWGSGRDAP